MGQKVHPKSIRLGITSTWDSKWFPKKGDYAKYLKEDIEIRKFLDKEFKNKGVSLIKISKTTDKIDLDVHSAKPGLIIGQQGSKIEALKEKLEKKFNSHFAINVHEIARINLDAKIVAENIAQQLERRISYRRACKFALEKAMESGAKGVKVKIAGRLNGVDIARSEFFSLGRVPLQTFRADIDYAYERAETTYGTIGVKVWIYKGEVFN